MSKAQSSSKTAPKNISVFLRVRPQVPREKDHTFDNISYSHADPRSITVSRKSGARSIAKEYLFNKVLRPNSTQKEVYDSFAKNAVEAAFDGQHGVLFVYGQTGSGKTFTISNDDPKNLGVLQQAMLEIWDRIAVDTTHDYTCTVSYVQLYNEILTDLLDDQKGRVRIQMGPEGRGDVILVSEITGLPVEQKVSDYKETMNTFRIGMSRKEMTSTSMNMTSSRSHTVFSFNMTKSSKIKAVTIEGGDGGAGPTLALEGRLVLCDLAGSERVSKTHAEGKTLDEATHINSSLLVLGKVVAALTEKSSQHAPFRESKLTRILQYSLLGNGNTSLVVNISPSDDNTEESLSAIGFGQRAIQIKQDAKRHEILDYKALYMQLMAELDAKNDRTLEDALAEERSVYEDRISNLEDRVAALTMEIEVLQKENKSLRAALPGGKAEQAIAGGSKAAAGGATGAGGVMASDWNKMNQHLKGLLQDRDAKIRTISDERVKLALLLAEEKRTCFRLAQSMQALALRYKYDYDAAMARQDELGTELARAKGTDYLSAVGNFISSPNQPNEAVGASPRGVALSGEYNAAEELRRAQATIRALRSERIELILYQSKAEEAIRMLAREKAASQGKHVEGR